MTKAVLTTVERELLALLKQDGRASVTTLAGKLKVSRATVQAKLQRLIVSGTIARFTIETGENAGVDLIRAVTTIEVEGTLSRSVIKTLNRLPEIASLHSTNGAWDLVAQIEVQTLPEFDRLLREIREIKGVLNSETSLLLNTARS